MKYLLFMIVKMDSFINEYKPKDKREEEIVEITKTYISQVREEIKDIIKEQSSF